MCHTPQLGSQVVMRHGSFHLICIEFSVIVHMGMVVLHHNTCHTSIAACTRL